MERTNGAGRGLSKRPENPMMGEMLDVVEVERERSGVSVVEFVAVGERSA